MDTPVSQVIYLMHQSGLSSLPVVDDEGRVVGVVSERDLIRAALPGYVEMLQSTAFLPSLDQLGRKLHEIGDKPIAKFMAAEVVAARPDDTDLHLADLMIRKGLKQIPVWDDQRRLVGVVRRIDLLHRLRR
jgi:CBS domain-containing protein